MLVADLGPLSVYAPLICRACARHAAPPPSLRPHRRQRLGVPQQLLSSLTLVIPPRTAATADQPQAALNMISRFTRGKPLAGEDADDDGDDGDAAARRGAQAPI